MNMSKNLYTISLIFCVSVALRSTLGLSISTPESGLCKSGECDNGQCLNGTCLCDEGWIGERCQFCDGRFRLTAESGLIHDGAGNYSLNTKCTWLLEPINRPKYDINGLPIYGKPKPIKLTFNNFSTECGWDHLHIFDGTSVYSPLVGSFSGVTSLSKDLILLTGRGFIYFFSDVAYSMGGFNITYRVIECPNDCSYHGYCNPDTELCVCDSGWSGDSCNIITSTCPNNCTAQGTCQQGHCQCDRLWTGDDCSTSALDASWLTVSTANPPLGRASSAVAVVDDTLYIIGGETLKNRYNIHLNSTEQSTLHRYNLNNYMWSVSNSNSTITERYGHTLTFDPDTKQLYMYGGSSDGLPTSDLLTYDVISDQWRTLPSGIYNVTGHTAHIIRGKLYVFFGQSAVYSFISTVQAYDIATSNWTVVDTSGVNIRGRYGHSSVYQDMTDSVFVFGGYRNNKKAGSYYLESNLYKYIVNTTTWVGLTPASRPFYLHSAELYSGYMLVSGGNSHNETTESSGSQCYSNVIQAYDICCDKWLTMEAADLSTDSVSRFGHSMFSHESKLYLYGGYNGLMLGDIVQLHIPDCSLFNSSFTCALGGALNPSMYNADPSAFLHSFCRWSDNDGCTQNAFDSCTQSSCEVSVSEMHSKCNQFGSDCHSCLSTEGCYWRSQAGTDKKLCGIIPPAASVNPELQELSICDSDNVISCDIHTNCEACGLHPDDCYWESESNKCVVKEKTSSYNNDGKSEEWETISPGPTEEPQTCEASCYTFDSCSNCTANSCLWCESLAQCIDTNSYLTHFLYGQCLEWTTQESKCDDVSCELTEDCDSCLGNAMCGWCNDPSNTGKGHCMKGELKNDIDGVCSSNISGTWFFSECPKCQCNGHSTCDPLNRCISCTGNTTGDHCERCADGYFGDPTNGGTCKLCNCSAVADACDDKTGACLCRVQGATGDVCEQCDTTRQYHPDTLFNQQCFYKLGVDFRYTFNFSKPEDKHVTHINLQSQPRYEDRDVELTLTCFAPAKLNLTLYSGFYDSKYQSIPINSECYADESIKLTISHRDRSFNSGEHDATFLLQLDGFTTPFVFQVSFTQYQRINLFQFFLVFFGCFLALLIIAGFIWKMKARYAIMQQRSAERQERRNMASRPFASVLLPIELLTDHSEPEASYHYNTKAIPGRFSQSGSESLSPFQRTSSKRSKTKLITSLPKVTLVGLEPIEPARAAIASVLIKLPTGGEDKPGMGCSGLAFASTLVNIGSNTGGNISNTKVAYKNGKVTFKPSNIFHVA